MKEKKELNEVRFDAAGLVLQDNLVRGSILPQKIAELTRNIIINDNVLVEGAIYGQTIEVRGGDVEVQGAVFANSELHVNVDVEGQIIFKKAVGSAGSVVSRANGATPLFCSDINAKTVALRNAYVAGSIYADEITLENCVVIGGVFATQEAVLDNCIVGTFYTPRVKMDGTISLLLPSAFAIEKAETTPATRMYNLSLADLGALYRGVAQDPNSGAIPMNLESDEVRSTLTSGEVQRNLRSFTVVGKVLAADMVDTDKFQNHFLLTAASLGPQLLKTYDLGTNADGTPAKLDAVSIRNFMFDILSGRKEPQILSATFSLSDIAH